MKIETESDFADYRVGVLRGVVYSDRLTKDYNPVKADSIVGLFRMLLADRIDLVLVTGLSGQQVLNRDFKDSKINIIRNDMVTLPIYHYLHQNYHHLLPVIQPVLREMVDSGETTRIEDDFIMGKTP